MKSYRIRYSPIALNDLEQVWDEVWESSRDFDIADNYTEGIRSAVKGIVNHPKTGERLYYDNVFTGIYYVNYKKYSAFYRIRDGYIEVGRILFNRSDYIKKIIHFE